MAQPIVRTAGLIGSNTPEDPFRPDVPDGTKMVIIDWDEEARTVTYEVPRVAIVAEAQQRAAMLLLKDKVVSGLLSDHECASVAAIFPEWEAGFDVSPGEVYDWDGTLVEVLQAHTTQDDWTPDAVPALFKIHRTPDMTEWIAGISVEVGEEFSYQGATYRVVQAHTTQTGWEPPIVGALWDLVV